MLKLDSADALRAYAARRELPWTLDGATLRFAPAQKPRAAVDAAALMTNALNYANEIERIV